MNDKLFLVYPLNKIDLLNKIYLSQECLNELAEEESGLSRNSLEFSCLKERLAIYLSQKKKE